MTLTPLHRNCICLLITLLALLGGCARMPDTGKTPLKPKSFSELQSYLLNSKAGIEQFRLRGPFAVSEQDNFEIRLSTTELVNTDLYLSTHDEKAPLVIFLHGYDSSKENHSFQAMHVASWGMHGLVLQLPNKGPWLANGRTLTKIIRFIQRWPEIIDSRIDVSKIILVGHSFGGAAVTIAMADGAPAVGGILLDPAALGIDLPRYLRQITTPVMVLGADERVALARNRELFYRFVPAGIAEVSIRGAAHEDGQYPASYGVATEELQISFVSALTAAAFSLAVKGNIDYAWASFGDAIATGKFFNARKK
jgi:pimeloyl-ACP methyl ester carboxylesterase